MSMLAENFISAISRHRLFLIAAGMSIYAWVVMDHQFSSWNRKVECQPLMAQESCSTLKSRMLIQNTQCLQERVYKLQCYWKITRGGIEAFQLSTQLGIQFMYIQIASRQMNSNNTTRANKAFHRNDNLVLFGVGPYQHIDKNTLISQNYAFSVPILPFSV